MSFFLGLDLGQANDFTALCVLERVEDVYHIRRLERVRGAPYPEIVKKVARMMRSPQLEDNSVLIVDQTGVGAPVLDLFREEGLFPIGISIHGGDKTTQDGSNWRCPKRDLVAVMQVLLQNGRLKIGWRLKLAQVLQGEMLNFRVKIDPATAHDSYSAWREQDHDDLVLSVALAAWYAERTSSKQESTWLPPTIQPDIQCDCRAWQDDTAFFDHTALWKIK